MQVRVDNRRLFLVLLVGLIAFAWLGLWVWGQSPYGRFLDHGKLETVTGEDAGLVAAGGGLHWHPAQGFAGRGGAEKRKTYFVSAVRVDYAWTPMGELGEAHWFSFGLVF